MHESFRWINWVENPVVKAKLIKTFYDTNISNFLFNIIKEGCNRRIAITVVDNDLIPHEKDECILSLSDSFNFTIVTPLMGRDFDDEVIEYRPDPLFVRLLNLQEMFKFIFNEEVVKEMNVYFTTDYDFDELDKVEASIDDFVHIFSSIIMGKQILDPYLEFVWNKD